MGLDVVVLKEHLSTLFDYAKAFLKWLLISAVVGLIGGAVGSVFHLSIDYVTELRGEESWLILLLPVGGLVIAGLYHLCRRAGRMDTNRVLEAVRSDEKVPFVMAPLIFVSTVITHLLGGSAGREGAALQLGGSIGYRLGRLFRLNHNDLHVIVMSGMSAVFAALFGTPLTATFFAIEVTDVGVMSYAGLLPCIVSATVASRLALIFGISPVRFTLTTVPELTLSAGVKVLALALLCALVSILFCTAIKGCEHGAEKWIQNRYLRALAGGGLIVLLTLLLRTTDYNGAGMDVITRAIAGTARPEAFLLKIVFTAVTIAAGFKGGEIVPTFFIGATFGCLAGGLLGLDPGFAAAIGFVALFCAVVNCPVASVLLALEVFGAEGILLFALACGVSYLMSGYFGLYQSQKIVYSKLETRYIDRRAN